MFLVQFVAQMNYDEMNMQSLRAECKKLGISSSQRKKSELVSLLKDHEKSADGGVRARMQEESTRTERPVDKGVLICPGMTEEEKIEARRKRFGPVESVQRIGDGLEQNREGEEKLRAERRRRFGPK